MARLRLEAVEFADLTRWRWVLTDDSGALIADHDVRLDHGCWQFEAFADLPGYLSWHVAPDRQRADEERIVAEVGTWIATQVLGPVAVALVDNRPATVMVTVPAEAEDILLRPLELARVGSRPLSVQDVIFVMRPASSSDRPKATGDRLRVLGLFSLPDEGHPLNLRRERHELVKLIDRIRSTGKTADVHVLQYGVTRQRLKDILEEGEGWDVIHISGHGRPGELLLETAAGKPDRIPAADFATLLDLARERVKLITLSACWSAATAAEQRTLLGLPVHQSTPRAERTRPHATLTSTTLATDLSRRLNCAVLAMRYPVDDDFAIALSQKLYDLLFDKAQSLPRALGLTLHELSAHEFRPLSVAALGLFGATTVDLKLAAPNSKDADDYNPANQNMSGFPPQPDRFVGRTRVMAEASEALAAQSGIPGVLLHGMPGGGKTACALELAYTHEHAFDSLVWYKAPDEGTVIEGALTDFSLTLEQHLPGFQMAHLVHDAGKLTPFLSKLTELMEQKRLLLIIDNAESLLTENANWRDDRWGHVIAALTAHSGPGRLILTSRRVPTSETALRVESVDALSPDEALLLARELPHLNALMHGEIPGINRLDAARLARRTLEVAQGHPKLLELAEGQAASPEQLAQLVGAGGQAWRKAGGLPGGFFAGGETAVTGEDYLDVLAAWTKAVADAMAPDERIVFQFLCSLEAPDRERYIIDGIWAKLWEQVDKQPPPSLDQALTVITTYGLAAARPGTSELYAVHPGVAATGVRLGIRSGGVSPGVHRGSVTLRGCFRGARRFVWWLIGDVA